MQEVHCTNCGAEGDLKRKGGCLYKTAYLSGGICVAMMLLSMTVRWAAGEPTTMEGQVVLNAMFNLGLIGGILSCFIMPLTSNKCCGTCSATTVVPVKQWKMISDN